MTKILGTHLRMLWQVQRKFRKFVYQKNPTIERDGRYQKKQKQKKNDFMVYVMLY